MIPFFHTPHQVSQQMLLALPSNSAQNLTICHTSTSTTLAQTTITSYLDYHNSILSACPNSALHVFTQVSKVRAVVCIRAQSLNGVCLFAILWTVACQDPLSMGFSRKEYWSGLPFPSPGALPDPGIEPMSPALQADSLPLSQWGSPESNHISAFSQKYPILSE